MNAFAKTMTGPVIRLHPDDNVVVARIPVAPGTAIPGEGIVSRDEVKPGYKIASRAIAKGEPVQKYSTTIGFAAENIPAGAMVHSHNIEFREFDRDYAHARDYKPVTLLPEAERATFQGIVRPDGRVATRNYIGIISTVNCSATVVHGVADYFTPERLADYPNVDGVVALAHQLGCGMELSGEPMNLLRRTMAGYIRHPNLSAAVVVGLGCERNQIAGLMLEQGLEISDNLKTFTMQETGGTRKSIEAGIAAVKAMLPDANKITRQTVSASHLTVGLQCGGSDGFSSITANPALGAAMDILVRQGGTAILSETPEIYGVEHTLTRRAVSREVGEKLIERIRWWEEYTRRNGGEMNNNPSPGNKAGGLTTILEKSLGAAAKGGTGNLTGVFKYAEPINTKGFVFMDSPGYDPCSVTGQVASGANIVCFTTGRGSVFGNKPSPSLKLATNSAMYRKLEEDMDVNCGAVLDDGVSIQQMGQRIFELILRVASGEKSKSEAQGFGDAEFIPWQVGAVM
jgi:altronate hydrolase